MCRGPTSEKSRDLHESGTLKPQPIERKSEKQISEIRCLAVGRSL